MSEILQTLQPYGCTSVSLEELPLPLDGSQDRSTLLIVASENMMEMLEEAVEEAGTMVDFVEGHLASVQGMDKTEAFRRIVKAFLAYIDLPPEQKTLEGKSLNEIYTAYAAVWAGETLIDEALVASSMSPTDIDAEWIEARIEDELLQLPLTSQTCYHAPLIVPMGGFNECPLAEYQAAVFRSWQEEYGFTPVVVTQDTWVGRAHRLPQSDEEALQLAKEHFMFCQYVMETFETLGQYAAYLKLHHQWYFWWD